MNDTRKRQLERYFSDMFADNETSVEFTPDRIRDIGGDLKVRIKFATMLTFDSDTIDEIRGKFQADSVGFISVPDKKITTITIRSPDMGVYLGAKYDPVTEKVIEKVVEIPREPKCEEQTVQRLSKLEEIHKDVTERITRLENAPA